MNDKFIIYIPGLFSTNLMKENEVVWPFKKSDFSKLIFQNFKQKIQSLIFKQNKEENIILDKCIDSLADENLTVGELNERYSGKIISLIKEHVGASYYVFTYDWRKDLKETTNLLAEAIDRLSFGNKTNVTIISHSAGGIISFMYLNDQQFNKNSSNFKKINKHITIGCPFQGSLKALACIFGIENHAYLTSKDIKKIIDKKCLESIYNLFPLNPYKFFSFESSKQLLNPDEFHILLEKQICDKDKIEEIYTNINNYLKLVVNHDDNNKIQNVHIIGNSAKQVAIIGFYVSDDYERITPIYENASSDGVVLISEALPMDRMKVRVRYINGKHAELPGNDEVLSIIEEELSIKEKQHQVIISKIHHIDKQNTLLFSLYVLKDNKRYIIDKIVHAENLIFNKMKISINDINKIADKFYIKTKTRHNSMLSMKNVKVVCKESNQNEETTLDDIVNANEYTFNFSKIHIDFINNSSDYII